MRANPKPLTSDALLPGVKCILFNRCRAQRILATVSELLEGQSTAQSAAMLDACSPEMRPPEDVSEDEASVSNDQNYNISEHTREACAKRFGNGARGALNSSAYTHSIRPAAVHHALPARLPEMQR